MIRVLKHCARLGVIAWATHRSECYGLWEDAALDFVSQAALREAIRQWVPWEQWFTEPLRLREALHKAGLEGIDVQERDYRISKTIAAFLSVMEISAMGRFLRHTLTASQ